ncbi:glycosyltransferase family 2 protein [soil metagenome]
MADQRPVASSLPSGKVPITVAIPAKNEANNLPRCLDHLRWADDVVVIDSSSRDATAAIAAAYGARVIDFKWNGMWPKKRNWALRNADFKHEWILFVDADEWIVPELAAEIAEAIKSEKYVGYYVNRRFIFMGRWLRHCGYYPSWNLRLIKRGHGEYERLTKFNETGSGDNEVHEHLVPTGPVEHLKNDMLHFAFPDIATFVEKHNRYSSWEAAVEVAGEETREGVRANTDLARRRKLKLMSRKLPFRSMLRFIYSYVFRLGVLDGRAGFIFCRLLAMYEFLSVAKRHELVRLEADHQRGIALSQVPPFDWKNAGPSAPAQK